MDRNETKKIAKQLRWKPEDVEVALDEFLKADSPLNKDELVSLCIQSRNPDERLKQSSEYFINQYPEINQNPDELVDLICDLLMRRDPCFQMIALFNIYDFYTGKEEIDIPAYEDRKGGKINIARFNRPESKVGWRLNFTRWHKSFIHWDTAPDYYESEYHSNPRFLMHTVEEHLVTTLDDIAHNPKKLRYKFLDIYIKYLEDTQQLGRLYPEPTSYIDDLQPLFRRVVKRVGYLAFNIEAFRNQINFFSMSPDLKESRINLEKIADTISPTAKTKIAQTKRRYWLWYVLIEKLQESGYGVRPSFRKAVETIGESTYSGISRRYYETQKKVRKEALSLEKIIKDNYLDAELKDLLIKAGIIEEESLFDYKLPEPKESSEGDKP